MPIDSVTSYSWPSARTPLVAGGTGGDGFARQFAAALAQRPAAEPAAGQAAGANAAALNAANAANVTGPLGAAAATPFAAGAGGTLADRLQGSAGVLERVAKGVQSVADAVSGVAQAGGAVAPAGGSGAGAGASSNGAAGGGTAQGVIDALNASSSAATGTAGASTATAADTQDRFLKLLVAQMRNQDPMNPMDNAAVTSQMAQISTVQGIESLNKTMSDWVSGSGSASMAANVGLIGHTVLARGSDFAYTPRSDGQPTTLGLSLQSTAKAVQIDIVDAAGRVVNTRTLNGQPAGTTTFTWDGRDAAGRLVPAGTLSVRVSATDGKTPVQSDALVPRRVTGVQNGTGGAQLQLEGGGTATPADVAMVT